VPRDKHGERVDKNHLPQARHAGRRGNHVLFRDPHLHEPAWVDIRDAIGSGRPAQVAIQRHDVPIGSRQLHLSFSVGVSGRHILYRCHSLLSRFTLWSDDPQPRQKNVLGGDRMAFAHDEAIPLRIAGALGRELHLVKVEDGQDVGAG